jgi:hypothetical protein
MTEIEREKSLVGNSGKWKNNQWVPNPNQMLQTRVKLETRNQNGKIVHSAEIQSRRGKNGKLAAIHLSVDHIQGIKTHIVDELDEQGKVKRTHDDYTSN